MVTNLYSGAAIDRAGERRRDGAWLEARLQDPETCQVPVWRSRHAVRLTPSGAVALRPRLAESPGLADQARLLAFLGMMGGAAHFAADFSTLKAPPDFAEFLDLRKAGPLLAREEAALLAYARGLLHWHDTQRHCGRCGAPTASRDGGHILACTAPGCGAEHYPRTDPAIIVLVTAGDHCLLGRQSRWPQGFYSTLAGFVEPGESLEEAVAREVMEEAGVAVARVRYHSSQPWPFPGSLMLGFHAEAEAATEPRPDKEELEDVRWFSRADLALFPEMGLGLPGPDTIAHHLIFDWVDRKGSAG